MKMTAAAAPFLLLSLSAVTSNAFVFPPTDEGEHEVLADAIAVVLPPDDARGGCSGTLVLTPMARDGDFFELALGGGADARKRFPRINKR